MKRIALLGLLAFGMIGCTDAEMSQLGAYGSTFRVTVYSGGTAVATYTSTGKVLTEDGSDGWYFTDAKTKKLVRVAGTVTVEQI